MGRAALPQWESDLVEETIRAAEDRLRAEQERARKRAVQLAREQAYHRLAAAIDRPRRTHRHADQLSLFPEDPTLFDDAS
jgi:hypothetical protein